MKKKQSMEWYDNPNLIINLLIGLLAIAILVSQTIAIRSGLDFEDAVNQLFNDNSVYTIYLIYFVLIKFRFGKRHFDALNVFVLIFQTVILLTSLLNIIQSMELMSVFKFVLSLGLWLYISNSLIKYTNWWKNFNLDQLSVKFIKNIDYFYIVVASSLVILILGLLRSFDFNYVLIILLDCLVYVGLARYIYLFLVHKERDLPERVEEEKILVVTTSKKKKEDKNV